MARRVRTEVITTADNFAYEVAAILAEYSSDIKRSLREIIQEEGAQLAQEISEASPTRTGEYAGSWDSFADLIGAEPSATVGNLNKPGLTHLLEKGHMNRGGTTRTAGRPHIAPAADRMKERFEKKLIKAIEVL